MDAGAFGWSSTLLNQHMGYAGRPLACRNASREEIQAYCHALRERGKGVIEYAMTRQVSVLETPEVDLLRFMLEESRRPVTFIAMFDRDDISEAVRTSSDWICICCRSSSRCLAASSAAPPSVALLAAR